MPGPHQYRRCPWLPATGGRPVMAGRDLRIIVRLRSATARCLLADLVAQIFLQPFIGEYPALCVTKFTAQHGLNFLHINLCAFILRCLDAVTLHVSAQELAQ